MHGTKPESLMAILSHGLNERVSGGIFGHGVYLAEDASKIDQYCTPDTGPGNGNEQLESLHEALYTDPGVEFPGDEVCYVLACRACLGYPVFTKDGRNNMNP